MRILIVGAGAVGSAIGARLLSAGRDVAILARPDRAAALAQDGIWLRQGYRTHRVPVQTALVAGRPHFPVDVILLAVKAYGLDGAIRDLAPYLGERTVVIPLLNGVKHLAHLKDRLGPQHIVGGLCALSARIDADGVVHLLGDEQTVTFGDLNGADSDRGHEILQVLSVPDLSAKYSSHIEADMWSNLTDGAQATADPHAAARLIETADFFSFLRAELPNIVERWRDTR